MDEILRELAEIERRCIEKASAFETGPVADQLRAMVDASRQLAASHSGSWLGYQALVYYGEFEPPPASAHFSVDQGLCDEFFEPKTTGDWRIRSKDEVTNELVRRSGNPDLKTFNALTADASAVFEDCKRELLATLDAVLAANSDKSIEQIRDETEKLKPCITVDTLIHREAPNQAVSSDYEALFAGQQAPPHVMFEAKGHSVHSHAVRLRSLARIAGQARRYFEKRAKMDKTKKPNENGRVFIGHGRSDVWHQLRDLLRDRLNLDFDEFNRDSPAGMATKERLEQMLDRARFAFIVMTAEDEHADGKVHARENVIHEAGLFQGRLGFQCAIVLKEDGCEEFSNIQGLAQIRFTKGNIKGASEEIRQVLEREGVIAK